MTKRIGLIIPSSNRIAEIEQTLDRPVVTSNQALIFHALALLGATDRRNCPGRLFETLGTMAPARKVDA